MQLSAILEILSFIGPALLAFSTSIIKGNKRFIVAIAVFFILRRFAVEAANQKALSEIQDGGGYMNPNALATLYKQAMTPGGYTWLMSTDGTDEDLLYELAAKTTNYESVANAYRTQFKRELTTDLQAELSTTDYQRFLTILNR